MGRGFLSKGDTMATTKKELKTITHEGVKVAYDPSAFKSWRFIRALNNRDTQFDAIDILLCGKADEIAEQLGDSLDSMTSLLTAITALEAKN